MLRVNKDLVIKTIVSKYRTISGFLRETKLFSRVRFYEILSYSFNKEFMDYRLKNNNFGPQKLAEALGLTLEEILTEDE